MCIGGRTGFPILLRGLRQIFLSTESEDISLTAIVCVSDNGGSSGTLRQSFEIPAVGDLREPAEVEWSAAMSSVPAGQMVLTVG